MTDVPSKLSFETLKDQDIDSWNSYVEKHDAGSFFHLAEWALLIEETFGHKHFYRLVKDGGEIVGLIPLIEMNSRLFGHSLVSTPFCVYGGAIANSDEIRIALENDALQLGKQLGVDYVELRDKIVQENPNFEIFCHHSTFIKAIEKDRDDILAGIKKKQRANVRQSLKKDLTVRIDQDVNTAYDIYSESVRNLGTPVFHKKYFPNLLKYFGNKVDVLTVESNGKAVSSVLNFYYKDQVLPYYGGGLQDARALKSNDLMYFELMCHARESGKNVFDFGRSKNDSGAFKYKSTWGIQPEPLHYRRALVKATEQPNLSPNNPKYALFINLWKKLPVSVSRKIGPLLSKYLG